MAWKDYWYGGNRSAAHRYLTNGLVLGAIAGAYGYFVDFVSSSLWWTAGSSLAVGVTIVCLVAIVHGFRTGRLTNQRSISLPVRFVGLLGLAAWVFCISWLLIVRAAPAPLHASWGLMRNSQYRLRRSIVAAPRVVGASTVWRESSWIGHSLGGSVFHRRSRLFRRM